MSDKNGVYLGSSLLGIVGIFVLVGLIYLATAAQDRSEVSAGGSAEVVERIKPIGSVKIASDEPASAPAETAPEGEAAPAAETEASAAGGEDAMALANANGCMGCHQVDTQLVGPAYKDVAAKYQGDADALDMLVDKVKNGGSGTWGQVPMPPNAHVSEEKIRTIVGWILSL